MSNTRDPGRVRLCAATPSSPYVHLSHADLEAKLAEERRRCVDVCLSLAIHEQRELFPGAMACVRAIEELS